MPFTPEEVESLFELIRAGRSARQACLQAGISRTRLHRNLDADPELRSAFEQAETDGNSADGSKIPKVQVRAVPAFVTKEPAGKVGRPPTSFDTRQREEFLELIRIGHKKFSALRAMQASARVLRNTIDADPEFRREV